MKEIELKYGCNPNQKPARIFMAGGGELPVEVMNGRPGYINFMDALKLLAARPRAQARHRQALRRQLQARLASGRGDRAPPHGRGQARILRRGRPLAHRHGLRPREGGRQALLYGDWAALSDTCDAENGQAARPRGERRDNRPRLHRRGARDTQNQAQGQL